MRIAHRKLVTMAVTAALLAFGSSSASAAIELGTNAGDGQRLETFQAMRASGFTSARIPLLWDVTQPTAPTRTSDGFNWQYSDAEVAAAATAGVRIQFVLCSSPFWSRKSIKYKGVADTLPASPTYFAAYAKALAHRYGPQGTFWSDPANGSVPVLPITSWQIWNEPNLQSFAGADPKHTRLPRPSAEYVALLKASAAAIRTEDPTAAIAVAGVASGLNQIAPLVYIKDVVAQLGKTEAAKYTFDAHIFTSVAKVSVTKVDPKSHKRTTTLQLDAKGSAAKEMSQIRSAMGTLRKVCPDCRLQVNEFHWSSSGDFKTCFLCVQGVGSQATVADEFLKLATASNAPAGLTGLKWYTWEDSSNMFGVSYGLVDSLGSPKPVLPVFTKYLNLLKAAT
jgi:hypothetical protein